MRCLENFADFRRLRPALSTLKIKDMARREAVIAIHPGVVKLLSRGRPITSVKLVEIRD